MRNLPRLHGSSSRDNPSRTRRTYTAREAAEIVGVTPDTLREWNIRGIGPRGIKQGTTQQARVYYPAAEIDRWIQHGAAPESAGT